MPFSSIARHEIAGGGFVAKKKITEKSPKMK
jgi:hypothetical protein